MRTLSTIQQSYIETIHQLCENHPRARTKDIADALGVRMASATEVVQSLATSGLLEYGKRMGATLTPKGLEIAEELQKRHAALAEFFVEIGCERNMAEEAACAVEHNINAEIADLLLKHLESLSQRVNSDIRAANEKASPETYLDHAAATPPRREVLDAFEKAAGEFPANPESAHRQGRRAEEALSKAATAIIDALGTAEHAVFWTASATEAINLAIPALLPSPLPKGMALATTAAEHPALENALRSIQSEIRTIPLRGDGTVDLEALPSLLDENVALLAIHHVNNETGATQDIQTIGKILRERAPNARFAVDTVQSIGKIPIPWDSAGIDAAFIGGHKIGAPAGGALIHRNDNSKFSADFASRIARERNEKHSIGRPDVPVAIALAQAMVSAETAREKLARKISLLNNELRNRLKTEFPKHDFNFPVPMEKASPYIAMLLLPPLQAEIVARMLSDTGTMVSAGSACEAWKSTPSRTLIAMGFSKRTARTAIRISFGHNSTETDVDAFVESLKHVVKVY